jgi:hypothetical protein
MTSVRYQIFKDGQEPGGTRVEVVTGIVTEYGTRANDGGFDVWPPDNEDYPTAKRIKHGLRDCRRVVRRRVVVIEDWAEV